LLTSDRRLPYNELETGKIIEFGVQTYFYTSGNRSGPLMAELRMTAMPAMKRFFKRRTPPSIPTISKTGAVLLRYDRKRFAAPQEP
jgi:hypothetical protein